jgi:hypothetical protein
MIPLVWRLALVEGAASTEAAVGAALAVAAGFMVGEVTAAEGALAAVVATAEGATRASG